MRTVALVEPLRDPILNKKGLGAGAVVSSTGTAVFSTIAATLLAPATGGLSVAAFLTAGASALTATDLLESRNKPEDVYFALDADRSEWVAKNVPVNGVWEVANNIRVWSNEVYRERYEDKQSSEFQTYIQQRPPTPFYDNR